MLGRLRGFLGAIRYGRSRGGEFHVNQVQQQILVALVVDDQQDRQDAVLVEIHFAEQRPRVGVAFIAHGSEGDVADGLMRGPRGSRRRAEGLRGFVFRSAGAAPRREGKERQ
jgi:hypothetical protein